MPQLLKGFEARTDIFDRMLLYFVTGRETQSCMQFWNADIPGLETDASMMMTSIPNFE